MAKKGLSKNEFIKLQADIKRQRAKFKSDVQKLESIPVKVSARLGGILSVAKLTKLLKTLEKFDNYKAVKYAMIGVTILIIIYSLLGR